jgi:hypothetical protein
MTDFQFIAYSLVTSVSIIAVGLAYQHAVKALRKEMRSRFDEAMELIDYVEANVTGLRYRVWGIERKIAPPLPVAPVAPVPSPTVRVHHTMPTGKEFDELWDAYTNPPPRVQTVTQSPSASVVSEANIPTP